MGLRAVRGTDSADMGIVEFASPPALASQFNSYPRVSAGACGRLAKKRAGLSLSKMPGQASRLYRLGRQPARVGEKPGPMIRLRGIVMGPLPPRSTPSQIRHGAGL